MRILKLKVVQEKTGLGRSAVYRLIAAGLFPRAVPLGARAVGWLESEIDGWILQKIADRDSSPVNKT